MEIERSESEEAGADRQVMRLSRAAEEEVYRACTSERGGEHQARHFLRQQTRVFSTEPHSMLLIRHTKHESHPVEEVMCSLSLFLSFFLSLKNQTST